MPLMLTIACLKLSVPPRICFWCHSFSLHTALNMLQRNSVTFRRRLNHVSTPSVNVLCNPILLPWLAQHLVLVMLTWLMACTPRNRQWTRLSIKATLSCMVSLKILVVSDVLQAVAGAIKDTFRLGEKPSPYQLSHTSNSMSDESTHRPPFPLSRSRPILIKFSCPWDQRITLVNKRIDDSVLLWGRPYGGCTILYHQNLLSSFKHVPDDSVQSQ